MADPPAAATRTGTAPGAAPATGAAGAAATRPGAASAHSRRERNRREHSRRRSRPARPRSWRSRIGSSSVRFWTRFAAIAAVLAAIIGVVALVMAIKANDEGDTNTKDIAAQQAQLRTDLTALQKEVADQKAEPQTQRRGHQGAARSGS